MNTDRDVFGWSCDFLVPFASLGVAVPAAGARWRAAFVVHDRDGGGGPVVETRWPDASVIPDAPATWGHLTFGLPVHEPPGGAPGVTVTIREGLDGAHVPDAAVGGGTDCGDGVDLWTEWGEAGDGTAPLANVGNLMMISDLRCLSKYYLTFPLISLPPGRAVRSARLILHHVGNCDPRTALPSWIQILLVGADWNEDELTWNNAPPPVANVAGNRVEVMSQGGVPGVAEEWDVSWAVAQVYGAGGSALRLAVYDADEAINSGKYFTTSDIEEYYEATRPTLVVELSE